MISEGALSHHRGKEVTNSQVRKGMGIWTETIDSKAVADMQYYMAFSKCCIALIYVCTSGNNR